MEQQTVSCGRDLCVCEECRTRVERPDQLGEYDLYLGGSPYPETIRLCPSCGEALVRQYEEEDEERYGPVNLRCDSCGGNAVDGYPDCPLARTYKPGQCRWITGVW